MTTATPRLRVLAFSPLFLPFLGGIEILLRTLLPALRQRGIETAVVTESAEGLASREEMDGTRVYRLPLSGAVRSRNALEPLRVMQQLRAIVAEERPDALHLHSVAQAAAYYVERLLSQGGALPYLVSLHGALETEDQLQVVRGLLGGARAVSGVSQACLDSAAPFLPAGSARQLIYNGIPDTDLRCAPWRQGETARLLCVGRLQLEKGYDLAIAALAIAVARGFDGRLAIIGRGEQELNFRALAARLGIADRMDFLGELAPSLVAAEMARAHALLAPSRMREGFGLVVAEAGRMGVPAIVTKTGGLSEVVIDGRSGLVVPREDADALADALLRLFRSEDHWRDLGAKARERVVTTFGHDACVEGYVRFYADHLGEKRRAL